MMNYNMFAFASSTHSIKNGCSHSKNKKVREAHREVRRETIKDEKNP